MSLGRLKRMLLAAALLTAAAPAQAQDKVVLGRIGLSFYAVTAEVVQAVLERLGHQVELNRGGHPRHHLPAAGEGSEGQASTSSRLRGERGTRRGMRPRSSR